MENVSLTADKTLKKAFSYVTDKRLMTINSVKLQDGSSPTSEAELEQALAHFWGPIFHSEEHFNENDLNALIKSKYDRW